MILLRIVCFHVRLAAGMSGIKTLVLQSVGTVELPAFQDHCTSHTFVAKIHRTSGKYVEDVRSCY